MPPNKSDRQRVDVEVYDADGQQLDVANTYFTIGQKLIVQLGADHADARS